MGNYFSYEEEIKPIKTIVIVSGFFDPIGIHHIILFEEAKKLGDYLIIGVNSDNCSEVKKRQPSFQTFKERSYICKALKVADEVVGFDDSDGSASLLIQDVYNKYKDEVDKGLTKIIFANGGDRAPNQNVSSQVKYVEKYLKGKVEFQYGVGGYNKISSSSTNLKNWVNNTMKKYEVDFRLENKY
jgi:cytidyltransferase-like protein